MGHPPPTRCIELGVCQRGVTGVLERTFEEERIKDIFHFLYMCENNGLQRGASIRHAVEIRNEKRQALLHPQNLWITLWADPWHR